MTARAALAFDLARPLSDALEAASAGTYRVTRGLVMLDAVAMIAAISAQILFRYVLDRALPWPEELATFLFIWMTFLGASAAVREDSNPRITLVLRLLPPAHLRWAEQIGNVSCIALCAFIVWTGVDLTSRVADQVSSAMGISMALVYGAVPVGMAFMLIHFLRRLAVMDPSITEAGTLGILACFVAAASIWVMPAINTFLLLAILVVLLLLTGLPIAFALAIATLFTMLTHHPELPLLIASQRLVLGLYSYVLIAVPLFIIAGDLMMAGGIGERLITFISNLVGSLRGGLAQACIVSSAFFANISGSGIADTAAIGSVMIPGMTRRGYQPTFAAALQASAGALGILFPPSIPAILYAWVSGVSLSALFIALFVPGVLVAVSFMVWTFIVATREAYPTEPRPSLPELAHAARDAVPALVAPLVIVGGIVSGIYTATESSVIAILYTLVLGVLVQRTLRLQDLPTFFMRAGVNTARVLWIMGAATYMGYLLTIERLGEKFSAAVLSIGHDQIVALLLINAFMIVIHSVMETAPSILIFVPVFIPTIHQLGIDPIAFGIIMILNSMIGTILPPIGVGLFVTSAISKCSIESVARAAVPFALVMAVDLLILIAVPDITLILPHAFGH